VKPPEDEMASSDRSSVLEYGLTYDDANRIRDTIPSVVVEAPSREIRQDAFYRTQQSYARIIGTVPWYPEISGFNLERGRFITELDMKTSENICVLGKTITRSLFLYEDPMGKEIKISSGYYKVVGLMEEKAAQAANDGKPGIDYNNMIFIPLSAARNRFGEILIKVRSGTREMERVELHAITVMVKNQELVEDAAQSIQNVLRRFHKKNDYEITVPLELLRRARETQRIFNIVLGSIAAISLLVGGNRDHEHHAGEHYGADTGDRCAQSVRGKKEGHCFAVSGRDSCAVCKRRFAWRHLRLDYSLSRNKVFRYENHGHFVVTGPGLRYFSGCWRHLRPLSCKPGRQYGSD